MSLVLPVFPLLRPEIPVAIPLRPLNPGLNLLAVEESGLAIFVVRDAVKIEPAADEFNLRVTRNHPSQFVDVNPVFLRAEGGAFRAGSVLSVSHWSMTSSCLTIPARISGIIATLICST